MLLKEIFRPTRKKIAYTLLVAISLYVLGNLFGAVSRHAPRYITYVAIVLLLPNFLLGIAGERFPGLADFYSRFDVLALILSYSLLLIYYYLITCLVLFCARRGQIE